MPDRLLAPAQGRAPDLPPPRAYGKNRTDLDLDFGRPDRPALVTAVLAHCCTAVGDGEPDARSEAAWNLPLGRRIARLLRIVALSTEDDALALTLRCPCADCAKPFEIALGYAQLVDSSPAEKSGAEILEFPTGESASLALRLPTGRDQVAWQKQRYGTAREATEAIVRSLIAAEPSAPVFVAPEQIEPLATAMSEADPLVAFQVSTQCPNCNRHVDIPVDLELAALQKLAGLRRSLLQQIHALATRYGWSEAETLAVAPTRRAEYLGLIADAEGTLA